MLKHAMPVLMTVVLAAGMAGCNTRQWMTAVKAQMPAHETDKSRVMPAYSQSGRVEASVLRPIGPPQAPRAK